MIKAANKYKYKCIIKLNIFITYYNIFYSKMLLYYFKIKNIDL